MKNHLILGILVLGIFLTSNGLLSCNANLAKTSLNLEASSIKNSPYLAKVMTNPSGSINFPHEINPNSILYLILSCTSTNQVWITFTKVGTLTSYQSSPQKINDTSYNITVNTNVLISGSWNYNITLLGNSSNFNILGFFQIIAPFDAFIQDILVPVSIFLTIVSVILFTIKHTVFKKKA